jgi:MoxR-like ATPase
VNISKSYEKIKSTLDIQPEEKLLIGKLANSATNPNLGYVDVYFEVNEGVTTKVNPLNYIDGEYTQKAQVFIRGSFESYEKEYGYDQLFLFKATINTQSIEKGSCLYTTVYSESGIKQHIKIPKESPFIAEISQTEFRTESIKNIKTAHIIERIEEDFQDTPHFFQIDTNEKRLLGPLIASDKDKNIFHGPRNKVNYEFWNPRSLSDYQTLLFSYEKFEEHIVKININNADRYFLINLDSFYIGDNNKPRNQDFTVVDLIPDNCLVNEFYRQAEKATNLKAFPKGKVKSWLDNKGVKLDKVRKSRVFTLLSKYEIEQHDITEIFKNILESEQAEPLLKEIANADEGLYLDRFRKKENAKLETFKDEILHKKSEIEQQNDAVKSELSKTQKELIELNKEKGELQSQINLELKTALENLEESDEYQNMINESNKTLSDMNKKIDESIKKWGHYEDLDNLTSQYNKLLSLVEFKQMREKELTDTISALNDTAKLSASELAKTYLNQQIISDIQNHDHYKYFKDQPVSTDNVTKNYYSLAQSNSVYMTEDYNINRKNVLTDITKRLKSMNRSIEQVKVEAALIAIMQNQFVVLIGVPGSGKTSFAIQLGYALGAANSTLVIPVAKDWTRPKDLMGYYNPVTNTYESGVTNFYPFYQSLDQHNENETTNSFLILDEFNLSQPEFYLSNLTGIADNSGNRLIQLGHEIDITIPTTNRFVCTANTDDTVQCLSPRMISRCAFIQFNELPELDQTVEDLIFPTDLPPLLTGSEMVSLFTATDSDVISESLKREIDKLISAFREQDDKYGNGVSVTPRKYNQLLQFCKVMDVQEHGQSTVLDYASTFFLLPLINGSGALFNDRLLNIKSIAEDLSLEEFVKHIDSIINEGNANFGHYRFIMG